MKYSLLFAVTLVSSLSLTLMNGVEVKAEGGKEADGGPCRTCAQKSKAIYEALNVAEQNATPPGEDGVGIFAKKTGGLECTRTQVVYPGAPKTYSCSLAADNRDDQAIYEALDVIEQNGVPKGFVGVSISVKTAGNLTCKKSAPVIPNPVYGFQCVLK